MHFKIIFFKIFGALSIDNKVSHKHLRSTKYLYDAVGFVEAGSDKTEKTILPSNLKLLKYVISRTKNMTKQALFLHNATFGDKKILTFFGASYSLFCSIYDRKYLKLSREPKRRRYVYLFLQRELANLTNHLQIYLKPKVVRSHATDVALSSKYSKTPDESIYLNSQKYTLPMEGAVFELNRARTTTPYRESRPVAGRVDFSTADSCSHANTIGRIRFHRRTAPKSG